MPGFSLPDGDLREKNRNRTGIIAWYAFVVSHLVLGPRIFARVSRETLTMA
jgi:hypothetical protein